MKKRRLLLLALLPACLSLISCSSPNATSNKSSQGMVQESQVGHDFQLQGVDGKTYTLSDFKGKKVYLKFWASWCSICLSTLEDTQELAKAETNKDYVVLTVVSPDHQGEKSENDFKQWAEKLDTNHFPILLDKEGRLLDQYQVRAYPTQLFFDKTGRLVKSQVGFMDKDMIQETLDKL